MKVDKEAMLLYVVTDRTWLKEQSLASQVEETLRAGASFVQLREKELPFNDFLKEAKEIKTITDRYQVPFVINDNIEIALECNADGVHVGQGDMDVRDVRKLIGNDKILGVSARTLEQALLAEKNGADYIGVGAVFSTSTKKDACTVSISVLQEICCAVSIPVVAIGGLNEGNIMTLNKSGVDGVAVVSAIFSKPNIYDATKELRELSQKMIKDKGEGIF